MVSLGADYSYARPGGASLRSAGVLAVGRYLSTDGRGITAAEYTDLKNNGIGVWLVREGSANGMLGGYAKGVSDAQLAVQQIATHGLPTNSVVYAAADWDVTSAQFAACDDYLRGFASVIGLNRTGIYAGLYYMNHVHSAGLAVAFWQAGATSWNHGQAPQMPIDFVQTVLTPPLPGTDHNYINSTNTTVTGGGATPIVNKPLYEDEEDMKLEWDTGGTGWLVTGPTWVALPSMQIYNLFSRVINSDQSKPQPDSFLRAEVNMMNAVQVAAYQGVIKGSITIPTLDTAKLADAVVTALNAQGITTKIGADDPELAKAIDAGFVRSLAAYANAAAAATGASFDPAKLADAVAQSLQQSGVVATVDPEVITAAVSAAIARATAAIAKATA